MTIPDPTPSTRPRRRRLTFIVLGLLCLVVILIMLPASIVVQEGLRASAAMKKTPPERTGLKRLLAQREPTSAAKTAAPKDVTHPATTPATTPATPPASATSLSSQTTHLRFIPLIPEDPALPDKFLKERTDINARFEEILGRIEQYERNKDRLTPEQARAEVQQILRAKMMIDDIFVDVMKLNAARNPVSTAPLEGTPGQIQSRLRDVYAWYLEASIDIYQRQGNWMQAGRNSGTYLGDRRWEWAQTHGGAPAFRSDFFREQPAAPGYYQRIIYCYWKAGGLNGYGKVLDAALEHYGQKVIDAWNKPKTKPEKNQ